MKQNNNSKRFSRLTRYVPLGCVALLALVMIVFSYWQPEKAANKVEIVSLSDVAAGISQGNIQKIDDTIATGDLIIHYQDGKLGKAYRDPSLPLLQQLTLLGLEEKQLASIKFQFIKSPVATPTHPLGLMAGVGLFGVVAFIILRNKATPDRWGAKNYEEAAIPKICFNDIAGLDENVQELRDIVSFLSEKDKYAAVGATMPRGVLMVGEPGTGKTLIAKAIAGEAGVPFFATSGSEFSEVFVGVGSSRIRSLFQKARKKAPCIIFIDEIDAVGRSRRRSESGAEMEQDQTLNQLLVEMDGFNPSDEIVVLAATNRLDVLDPALTRPGRFDRRLHIGRPDLNGREAILQVHTRGKKLAPDVCLANIARATSGLVGADLAAIANEAAIIAVRNSHAEIEKQDFDEAIEKTLAGGVQHKNRIMSEDERRIIAYHEAGHAVVIHTTKLSDPVYKVTIIPRGQMGGYTISLPENDQTIISRGKIMARIIGLLGGRAAEDVFFQDVTTGASNDLNEATRMAEEMVLRLGMDPEAGLRVSPQSFDSAYSLPQNSQRRAEMIDDAVSRTLESCYNEACRIISEYRHEVQSVAEKLLDVETLDREQFIQLVAHH